MDFGISFGNSADHWKVTKRAEQLGFSHAWFSDTQLVNADLFVAMAAAAVETTKIHLGSAVLIPSNRIAPVTANGFASLNSLAPGRIHLGVSTGFTARRTMGLPAIKLAEMEEHIRIVRALLGGETTEWDYEGKRRKIRFLNPDLGQINIDDPIPLHISAMGPKGRRLTARLGAHWMDSVPNLERGIHDVTDMRAAWAEEGHDPDDFYTTAITGGCVLDEGEAYDSPRALAQAGPAAAIVLHNLVEAELYGSIRLTPPPFLTPLMDEYRKLYQSYTPEDARYLSVHRGHLLFLRPDEKHLITADLIRAMTLTGTKEELRETIREMGRAGYMQFSCHIRYGQEDSLDRWADVIAGV
jgi:5,10-methylenetetrahydromethanopterin reductase